MNDQLLRRQLDFVNLRFGMFIHFNSATFQFNTGDVVDWEYASENGGPPRSLPFDPAEWAPTRLNCGQWLEAAKLMKARFAVLVAKHHEGFALWPTAHSAHCVKNATVKTDVVREFMDTFREGGVTPALYFSVLDLTAGITRTCCTEAQKAMIKAQITELLTGYGEIPFLIIDGWSAPWGGPSYDMLPFAELDDLVKSLQPNCLLMNIGEMQDIRQTDAVFFENAAGQEVTSGFAGPGAGCNILTDQWFWRKADTAAELKTAEWALTMLHVFNQSNVTFILNGSLNTDGLLDDNLMARYAEIGQKITFLPPIQDIPDGWLRRE